MHMEGTTTTTLLNPCTKKREHNQMMMMIQENGCFCSRFLTTNYNTHIHIIHSLPKMIIVNIKYDLNYVLLD